MSYPRLGSPQLERDAAGQGWYHWCPACQMRHRLPDQWKFDGNLERPTFTPSFKHSFGKGRVCHYILTKGQLHYCSDCTHNMAGQVVPLPLLSDEDLPCTHERLVTPEERYTFARCLDCDVTGSITKDGKFVPDSGDGGKA